MPHNPACNPGTVKTANEPRTQSPCAAQNRLNGFG